MLLSTSFVIRDLLSDATLNDRDAFTTGTVFDILEEIKGRIKVEAIEPYVKENRELILEQSKTLYERDMAVSALEDIIVRRSKLCARLSNVLWGLAALLGLLVPVCLSFFVTWYFALLYVLTGLLSAYMGFVRGFRFGTNYQQVYERCHLKLSKKLLRNSPTIKTGAPSG